MGRWPLRTRRADTVRVIHVPFVAVEEVALMKPAEVPTVLGPGRARPGRTDRIGPGGLATRARSARYQDGGTPGPGPIGLGRRDGRRNRNWHRLQPGRHRPPRSLCGLPLCRFATPFAGFVRHRPRPAPDGRDAKERSGGRSTLRSVRQEAWRGRVRTQYESEPITSPPFRVPSAHQGWTLTLSLMNLTEPSEKATFTPPGWLLLGGAMP